MPLVLSLALLGPLALAGGPGDFAPDVDGVLVRREGARLTLRGPDVYVTLRVAEDAPLLLQADELAFDAQRREVTTAFASAIVGRVYRYPLAPELYLHAVFPDAPRMQASLDRRSRTLRASTLYFTASRPVPEELSPLELVADVELRAVEGGAAALDVRYGGRSWRTHARQTFVTHRSLDELIPFETDVFCEIERAADGSPVATRLAFRPVGVSVDEAHPERPRYLYVGDSISRNYGPVLEASLAGELFVHRPPENCGASRSGRTRMHRWLGAFREPGRGWDVISFNFGHWDHSTSKENYQANLEAAIEAMEHTGARLLWVTSGPVSYGFNLPDVEPGPSDRPVLPPDERESIRHEWTAGPLEGRVPGRNRLLNRWAQEVLARHPAIAVCDLWQFVKDRERTTYETWWFSKNVHYDPAQAAPLGELVAASVRAVRGTPPPAELAPYVHPGTRAREGD